SDERETTGARALLNFGHTVGHALEAASHAHHDPLRHGEAVALGMLAAARVQKAVDSRTGGADHEPRIAALLAAVGLPTDLDRRLTAEALARVAVDKKRGGEHIHFVVVDEPGRARLLPLTPARIHEILLGGKLR
ncbi:MAG: 3-dehydroquinate synthase family protein, partial [Polyangia bacterium]